MKISKINKKKKNLQKCILLYFFLLLFIWISLICGVEGSSPSLREGLLFLRPAAVLQDRHWESLQDTKG